MITPEDDFIDELAAKLRPALLEDIPDELNPEALESIVAQVRQPGDTPRERAYRDDTTAAAEGLSWLPASKGNRKRLRVRNKTGRGRIRMPRMPGGDGARSIARKITLTAIVGALSFPITDLVFSEFGQQFAMAVGVAAVVLLIQFLVDFEQRLLKTERAQVTSVYEIQGLVDKGFAKVNDATRLFSQVEAAGFHAVSVTKLVQHAAAINPGVPQLVCAFAQSEIDRVSEFLRELADLQVTYDGEDRDWLLGLTRYATTSIDAISIPEVDSAGSSFHSFWESDLGRRYLDLQREAVRRRVRVRRVFVTERDEIAGDPALQRMCRIQAEMGIDVRLLYPSAIPHAISTSLFDFILFDSTLSYEVDPAPHVEEGRNPMILHTRLILRGDKVRDRIERYKNIWGAAVPWSEELREEGSHLSRAIRGTQ